MMNKLIILSTALLLSACASMMSGTKENIVVRSDKDAKIYLNGEYLGEGVAMTTISKKNIDRKTLRVTKKGCQTVTREIETKIDPTTFLGCILDACLVTVLVIDWGITGAVKEAVQTNYFIDPICD